MGIKSEGRLLPSYPLFVKDPFFSIWSPCDTLNGGDVEFWTGLKRKMYGVVYANGVAYTFLGRKVCGEDLKQKSVSISSFTTDYEFTCDAFDLAVSFISPLTPNDLTLLSCPVCYMAYTITPKRELKNVKVALVIGDDICYDSVAMPVHGGVMTLPQGQTAWFGLKKQLLMSQTTDTTAAEWGHWYLTAQNAVLTDDYGMCDFYEHGALHNRNGAKKYAVAYNSYDLITASVDGKMTLAFDDTLSINYFGDYLKGYYFRNGATIYDAIADAWNSYDLIMKKLADFDEDLKVKTEKYGDDYLMVLYAGLRQSVGAHKLALDRDGNVLFLSKECNSNGCIATADVSYPSIPLYLLYNPELVKGMLRPIFKFADMPVWTYDFAPHDVGTYPHCCGQIYAFTERNYADDEKANAGDSMFVNCNNDRQGNEFDVAYTYPNIFAMPNPNGKMYEFKYQMPVEECGNMLIMVAATLAADGDVSIAKKNFKTLKTWVKYLKKYGLMPGNQLCTDDFAGHLDKNVNLSVKAIVGIRAFAYICDRLGKTTDALCFANLAEEYAAKWREKCYKVGVPTPLTFDGGETFSLKYNMAFDVLMGFGLFDKELREAETDAYIARNNRFGVPLDSRAEFTKSDWILWAAALTSDTEKRKKLIAPIVEYLRGTPSRVPFSDWYETVSGRHHDFKNRTVQGGLFILLLADSGKLTEDRF